MVMYKLAGFLLLLLFSMPLSAQTADKLETLLEKPVISWPDAAIFVLEASERAEISDPAEAFNFVMEQKWLPKKAQMGDNARLNGLALLLMRAFDIKGGIMYSIAKSPHFAYRELVYREIIQGKTDPGMAVSGDDFLFILSRVLSMIDDTPTGPVETIGNETADAGEEAQRQDQRETLAAEINVKLADLEDTNAEATSEGVTIRLSNIQFGANSAILTDSETAKLREIAEILKAVPGKRILVAGHTAMAGTRDDQLRTSLERAQAAAAYLAARGARRMNEITVQGYGSDRPIADNRSPEGMAANRRVEITILD